jgi:hypothetical protein
MLDGRDDLKNAEEVGVPKHSELEPNYYLAKGNGKPPYYCGLKVSTALEKQQTANIAYRQFHDLLAKANKENPRPADVKALDLLYKNKDLDLWKRIMGIGALART